MNKRYILVAAGEDKFTKLYEENKFITSDDFIIAVDGGLKVLEKNNLKPSIFIGDNDSNLNDISYSKLLYNSEKDESDFELAISYIKQNIRALNNKNNNNNNNNKNNMNIEILVFNATGNRLDHFLSTIRTLIKNQDLNIKIIDDKNIIYLIKEKEEIKKDTNYKYVSFFNPYENTKITLKGFKYNLDNYIMDRHCNLCLSNQVIDVGVVKCNKAIISILSKD